MQSTIHLVVLVHGLHGSSNDMRAVATNLLEHVRSEKNYQLVIHNSSCNSGVLETHKGIDICGQKLAEDILHVTATYEGRIGRFSIIGHSLGGLISRYAVGILEERRYFETITPMVCISQQLRARCLI